tara:strand:+ start:9667 stop:10620 length:954 start_codon:yes stop_codon:yes gene_type:complete
MKTINKIILAVTFSFIITLSIFIIIFNQFSTENVNFKDHSFFNQEFDPKNKKIFLLGSSHTGQINSTLVQNNISNIDENVIVYNLAYNGDTPKKRIEQINQIISLQPSIIFYGVSYRDFGTNNIEQRSPLEINNFLSNSLNQIFNIDKINPKVITLEAIRDIFSSTNLFPPEGSRIYVENQPFFSYDRSQMIIVSDKELKKQKNITQIPIIEERNSNEQFQYFKKFLQEMKNNEIEVVIFTTPVHKYYLENMQDKDKKEFQLMLNEIMKESNLKIYEFSDKYTELQIWYNLSHVTYNKKAMIYSEGVSEMIISEFRD